MRRCLKPAARSVARKATIPRGAVIERPDRQSIIEALSERFPIAWRSASHAAGPFLSKKEIA
jgi:hypothetical protein